MKELTPITDYEGLYEIDSSGRVYSIRRGKYLKHSNPTKGYPVYNLSVDGVIKSRTVHRMLAVAFIPNPENKRFVNHLDGDKSNYSLDNLEWCTASENMYHAWANNLMSRDHYKRTMDERDAKRDAGLVEFRVWVTPDDHEVLAAIGVEKWMIPQIRKWLIDNQ